MKQMQLELNGMTCGSCEKIIARTIERNGGTVQSMDSTTGKVVFTLDESALDTVKQGLLSKGFSEKGSAVQACRGDPERVWEYITGTISGKLVVENKLLNSALVAIIIIGALLVIATQLTTSLVKYYPLLPLFVVTSLVSIFSYVHMKLHGNSVSCMNGMMMGMTIGMISGFMVGALIGATNGMFMGSAIGLAVGVVLGFLIGKKCGIMGAMEGLMAGFMAGPMGAMTSVMLLNDNMVAFLYMAFGVGATILGGLSYMMHREAESIPNGVEPDTMTAIMVSVAMTVVLVAIAIVGPKSALVYS